ncbi:Hpt domain-containing protein, partial [Pyxidicoccus sp. 3LG]
MNPSDRLIKQFRDLVTVRLERINRSLMELETGANNAEAGRGVLRELHGLKGEARMMGFDDINALVHEMEELVRCTEPHRYTLTPPSADALLHAADAVLLLSGALPSADPPPEVDKLVSSLQACIRSESERLPASFVLPAVTGSGASSTSPAGPGAGARGGPGGPGAAQLERETSTGVPVRGGPGVPGMGASAGIPGAQAWGTQAGPGMGGPVGG